LWFTIVAVDAAEIICDFMLGGAYLLIFLLLLHMEKGDKPKEAKKTTPDMCQHSFYLVFLLVGSV